MVKVTKWTTITSPPSFRVTVAGGRYQSSKRVISNINSISIVLLEKVLVGTEGLAWASEM